MRAARLVLAVAGLAAMAYAALGALADPDNSPIGQAIFLGAVVVGHDGLLLPAAIGLGLLACTRLPAWARPIVQGALFASATVTLIALPFVLGLGRRADNPSALPLSYGRGLALVLAVVWLTAGIVLAARFAGRRAAARSAQAMPEPGHHDRHA